MYPQSSNIILLLNMLEFNRKHAYMDEVQVDVIIYSYSCKLKQSPIMHISSNYVC